MNDAFASCYVVSFEARLDAAPAMEAALDALLLDVTVRYDYKAQMAVFASYLATRSAAESHGVLLEHALQDLHGVQPLVLRIDPVPHENWSESWKHHFKAVRVSNRFIVKPSWETMAGGEREWILELDPGMSFGTGHHFTTLSCLRFIDETVPVPPYGGRFLDAGCGSGILTIAAVRLGYTSVSAFDHDPLAVRIARDNILANGISVDQDSIGGNGRVDCRVTDLACGAIPGSNHTVVANMLADVLMAHASTLALSVQPGGWLVLAGMLVDQYAGIKARYESLGFLEKHTVSDGEWRSGCFSLG